MTDVAHGRTLKHMLSENDQDLVVGVVVLIAVIIFAVKFEFFMGPETLKDQLQKRRFWARIKAAWSIRGR